MKGVACKLRLRFKFATRQPPRLLLSSHTGPRLLDDNEVELGELLLSLNYLPSAGRLNVDIIRAKQLLQTDMSQGSDPFVKIQLVHGLKLAKTKKTSFIKGTIDPFYNESFSFRVQQEELGNASLVFTGMWARPRQSCLLNMCFGFKYRKPGLCCVRSDMPLKMSVVDVGKKLGTKDHHHTAWKTHHSQLISAMKAFTVWCPWKLKNVIDIAGHRCIFYE
ncbi:protein kinase C-like [Sphaerodactylus townsendi]|uniref:protein kinase C-like n=1 Tax=Sphaerodactylus townsendi TaxID=933632 RepID=UPI0020274BE6|nr:protein kinase C-like [Sphaerodactylus townsendi]